MNLLGVPGLRPEPALRPPCFTFCSSNHVAVTTSTPCAGSLGTSERIAMMEDAFSLSSAAVGSSARIASGSPIRARDALLFAATEFARICIDFVRQSDARERIFGAFDGAAGMLAAHVERKAHVV